MSCPFHLGERIEITGKVGGFIKEYPPPGFKQVIYGERILWLRRFNVHVESVEVFGERYRDQLSVIAANLILVKDTKTAKTYKFAFENHPAVPATVFVNGEPKTDDRILMRLTPKNLNPNQKHFCIGFCQIL